MADHTPGDQDLHTANAHPDKKEREFQQVMAEILMAFNPAKLTREELHKDAQDLKQHGFGDLTLTVEKDGHQMMCVELTARPLSLTRLACSLLIQKLTSLLIWRS